MTITALCFECGARAEHAHHVVPRSRGGTRTVPLCVPCHGKAHDVVMSTSVLTLAALAVKKSKGERVGTAPYGFRVAADGIHLEENPEEYGMVEKARALRASGMSLRAIATEMDRAGMRSRAGKTFQPVQVARMVAR